MLTTTAVILAASTGTALGGSLIYLLLGGGVLGAAVIFGVMKMLYSETRRRCRLIGADKPFQVRDFAASARSARSLHVNESQPDE